VAAGGKIVPFAGYLLPVQYTDVIAEHMSVRERAGLFDVSHMGEVMVSGKGALPYLNRLLANDFTGMRDGRVRYSPMCNPGGGIIDDLIVYRFSEDRYMIVVNASNREKDVDWMLEQLHGEAELEDISDRVAQLALQGPGAKKILARLCDAEKLPVKYYTFTDNNIVAGVECLISQTGYTGEFGYELYCNPAGAVKLWDAILEAGREDGLIPCGLGARETLRLEAAMPLYGHEMNDEISPLETGLAFAVKLQKPDFIGKAAIESRGAPKIARVGLKMTGRGIAREHNPVYLGDRQIGETTSGTHCPYLGGAYAMALVNIDSSATGANLEVEVRGRRIPAEIVALPFYQRAK
jgi:aminomethyltransferase